MDALFEFAQVSLDLAAVIGAVFLLLLHAILAQAVANDVNRLHTAGRKSYFLGAVGWAFSVLVLGLIALAFYWVIHDSTWGDPAHDRSLQGR